MSIWDGENMLRPWWCFPRYEMDYSQSPDWYAKGL